MLVCERKNLTDHVTSASIAGHRELGPGRDELVHEKMPSARLNTQGIRHESMVMIFRSISLLFKKGLPWETPDVYQRTSPTYGLGNVSAPTLIHVGGNDQRCPPGHSRMLYRALQAYVKVPTELIVYPGEPHGLAKYSSRKAKMEWDLVWFERYLKGKK